MRGGGLLESCRDVDRIARRESFLRARHHLARVDADAAGDPQLGQRVAHLDRSATRPQCIVLVRRRDAEHRHHGVANELLDGAAVSLDDRLHLLEVACEQRPQRLGIGLLSQLRRAAEVAEQTVTVLRTSREDDGVPRVAPQLLQKAAPSGLSRPQLAQMSTA